MWFCAFGEQHEEAVPVPLLIVLLPRVVEMCLL